MDKRFCKGIWIPIDLWESKLPWEEKILFAEIDSRSCEGNEVILTDEDIENFLCVSKTAAKRAISHLLSIGKVLRTKRVDGGYMYQSCPLFGSQTPSNADMQSESSPKKETRMQREFNVREKEFLDECLKYVGEYSEDMIKRFYTYWSEPNKTHTRMRYEKEPTWEITRRLRTWATRDTYNSNITTEPPKKGRTVDEIFGLK